jgi:hypothetical protein
MCGFIYRKILKKRVFVMTPTQIAFKLIKIDKNKRTSILANAIDLYLKVLLNIANDIYESCIAEYYGGYSPKYYNRHGNIEGFNLYKASDNDYSNFYLGLSIEEDKLLPYSGKGDKRGKVLRGVLNGLRGGPNIPGWPIEWSSNYPNNYSAYRIWYSSGSTIKEILDDFSKNAMKDNMEIFWQCVERQI